MKLVIVESPAKCNTIQRYLGEEYVVKASLGHIRDLSTRGRGGLGVDVDNEFAPIYIINKDKQKVVKELKDLARKADEVILATDPDREGEAIAWHLAQVLNLNIETNKRLEFHEITRESITNALANPRTIDLNLVSSQEARRILDRIIGFKLSALVNRKIHSKSAGRVQSATLKLIVDHDDEINSFVPQEYYEILTEAKLDNEIIKVNYVSDKAGNKDINSQKEADKIINSLGNTFKVISIDRSVKSVESKPPFKTSTLQQEAFAKLHFSTAKTASVSQSLYEGIQINGEHTGLITYIRTDDTRLSSTYVEKATAYIKETFGQDFIGTIKKGKISVLAQEAHEAIRPTSNHRTPESIRQYLSPDQYNLYKLIYRRAIASLMKAKKQEVLSINLENNGYIFKLNFNRTIFPGYELLYKYDEEEQTIFPSINVNDTFELVSKTAEQKFTVPPARYSEAKVVSLMEEIGIGRPSTYASTIATLKKRKYVSEDKGLFTSTEQGTKTSIVLNKYFPEIVDAKYTADMESKLDSIQEGKTTSTEILTKFYKPFTKMVEDGYVRMYADELVPTGEMCPKCGHPLVYKEGKNGKFIACSNYPDCTYVKKEAKEVVYTGENCPECGKPLVERIKNGKKFIACSGYPKCKYHVSLAKQNEPEYVKKCPDCEDGYLVKKKGSYGYFLGCSNYPKCKHMEKIKKRKD
ncbi:MAG: type I DNA topoisomerase [Bacilli bacterium]|nr:type I DNA topoisomerase [Bacilli bacterium]